MQLTRRQLFKAALAGATCLAAPKPLLAAAADPYPYARVSQGVMLIGTRWHETELLGLLSERVARAERAVEETLVQPLLRDIWARGTQRAGTRDGLVGLVYDDEVRGDGRADS